MFVNARIPLGGACGNDYGDHVFLFYTVMEAYMKVILNGDPADIRDNSTVARLLEDLQIGRDRVAVEVGLEIVSKAQYDNHVLQDGDKIEIVQFVGGG